MKLKQSKFTKAAKDLWKIIADFMSRGVFEVIDKNEIRKTLSLRQKIGYAVLSFIMFCLAVAVIVIGYSYISNKTFMETFYQVGCGKVEGNIRIIHISDLHESQFGKNNKVLLKRMKELKPDIICMTGDMVEKSSLSHKNTVKFFEETAKIAPVFFIYGNNEYEWDNGRKNSAVMQPLRDAGINILEDRAEYIKVGKNNIDIFGVFHSAPKNFWKENDYSFPYYINTNEDNFKLMLIHEPYVLELKQNEYYGDLVLAGHTHGGMVRLPVLGELYERRSGILPTLRHAKCFIGGKYELPYSNLIVSRGLTNRGFIRVNNRPELVIIDVNRY